VNYGKKSERKNVCGKREWINIIQGDNWDRGKREGKQGKGESDKMTSSDFLPRK